MRRAARTLSTVKQRRTSSNWSTTRGTGAGCALVQEVAYSREDHGHPETVGSGDHIVVAHGASGLNHGGGAGTGGFFNAVGEREKSIRGDDAAGERRLRFHDRDLYGIDAAHLARTDTECRAVFCENDSIGFDVLRDFPGEAHGLHLRLRRRALCHDLQLGFYDFALVRLLHENTSKDALELEFALGIEAVRRQFEQPQILFRGEDSLGLRLKARGGNTFDEELRYFFGGSGVDHAVEGQDASERGNRVGGERFQVGIEERLALGRATGGVVFDDDRGGLAEFGGEAAGGFEIDIIVVGELFALKLSCGCQASRRGSGRGGFSPSVNRPAAAERRSSSVVIMPSYREVVANTLRASSRRVGSEVSPAASSSSATRP